MATEEPRTSSVVRVPAELVIDPALAELDVRVVPAVRAALVVPENRVAPVGLAVRVAPVALANRVAPVGLVVRVAPVALANRVAPAGLAVRVAPVALANRVALELVPVVAGPVLDQVEAQRRTRSATAAHHRGQVPVLAAEDLAAAAETTRAPAATGAAAAWVAGV
jgi:hypothetical protein